MVDFILNVLSTALGVVLGLVIVAPIAYFLGKATFLKHDLIRKDKGSK